MGFLKWLRKQGATGSIARWVVKHYKLTKADKPDLDDYNVCWQVFNMRFSSYPPAESERNRYKEIINGYYFDKIRAEPLFHYLNYEIKKKSYRFASLHTLCMAIIYIEMNVTPNDVAAYKQCFEIISEELKRLGIN